MAEGIDRKADERMEFTTSKDVTVAPTYDFLPENKQPFANARRDLRFLEILV